MARTMTVPTRHAQVSVADTGGDGLPVLFLHGNSCSKEAFVEQFNSPMAKDFRMIAMDLPGHGDSDDADNPDAAYCMPGYAEAACDVLEHLGVSRAAVVGWSLGGHVAIELIPRFSGLVGLMIMGTPPVHPTPESLQGGYRMHPMLPLISQEELTEDEVMAFADGVFGNANSDEFVNAVRRTDGRTRKFLFATVFDGRTADQQTLAEQSEVPIAIVNGENDPIINVDYINSLTYASLWEKHCFVMRGEGHVPFLTNPEGFNKILGRFLNDMAEEAKKPQGARKQTTKVA